MNGFLVMRLRLWLQDAFWLIPLLGMAFAYLLDVASSGLDQQLFDSGVRRVISPSAATTLLVAVGGGMITFTGFVFSLVLLVLQYGSSAYSPRAVSLLLRARSTQWILALFLATIVLSFLSVPEAGSFGRRDFAPVASLLLVALLLMASLIGFLALLHLVGKRIRVDEVLSSLGHNARRGLRRRATLQDRREAIPLPQLETLGDEGQLLKYEGAPGQIVGLSLSSLTRIAARHNARIVVLLRTGDAVSTGSTIAAATDATVSARQLSRCLLVRHERAIKLDPLYALRIIVDVALRALSPAVNDPTTAVRALDEVEGVLRTAASMQLGPVSVRGDGWEVQLPLPAWSDVVDLALMEIVEVGITQPQVTRRLTALLSDLLADIPDDRARALLRYQRRLARGVQENLPVEYQDIALTGDRQGIGGSR